MNDSTNGQEKNDILIRSRKHIDVTGVRDVVSFDDRSVVMVTSGGDMAVEGDELKIGVLDIEKGVVSVDGRIGAVIYYDADPTPKHRLFGKGKK